MALDDDRHGGGPPHDGMGGVGLEGTLRDSLSGLGVYPMTPARQTDELAWTLIAEPVREELGTYGWVSAIQDPQASITATTGRQVVVRGAASVSYDCATGALALKGRLEQAGYQHVTIAAGRATDGIYEVFALVGGHTLTVVPGRAPVDDPALRVEHVLTAEEEQQLAAFRQQVILVGSHQTDRARVYPMSVIGPWLVMAGVDVDRERITIHLQTRPLSGQSAVQQLEVAVARHDWRAAQALARELTPEQLMARLAADGSLKTTGLPEDVMPQVAGLLAAFLSKLDLTPRPLVVPPVGRSTPAGSCEANLLQPHDRRTPSAAPASGTPAPGRSGLRRGFSVPMAVPTRLGVSKTDVPARWLTALMTHPPDGPPVAGRNGILGVPSTQLGSPQ